jgi:nitrate/TMAO reductase-like tetraheme cytochrome c subunit
MKIIHLGITIFALYSLFGFAQNPKKELNYIGSIKCKTCHNATKNGAQYKLWASRPHAKAYEVLKGESAKKKAQAAGVEDPLKSENCLSCHTTAYGKKNVEASYKLEEGVGCEACHGPGSEYKKMSTMKDRAKSVAAGLLLRDEKTCTNCHKQAIPGHDGKFTTYEKEYAKIAHPVPPENDRRKK